MRFRDERGSYLRFNSFGCDRFSEGKLEVDNLVGAWVDSDAVENYSPEGYSLSAVSRVTSPMTCLGMRSSMSRTGVCWDSSMAESFFSMLKNERVYRTVYATKAQARKDLIQYIAGIYNSRRRHSPLGKRRPKKSVLIITIRPWQRRRSH